MKYCIRKSVLAILFFTVSILFAGCKGGAVKVTDVSTGMGTVVQKTLYVEDSEAGEKTLKEIDASMTACEGMLSWRLENSVVAEINLTAGEAKGYAWKDSVLEKRFEKIWEISGKSNGALDVTIGEVTRLWNLDNWAGKDGIGFEVPAEAELVRLLANTGYDKVKIENGAIYLPENMALDLGAVGKGIACDIIGEYVKTQSTVKGAVITVGGSVVTYGSKPEGGNWNVAIVHPRKDGAYLGAISLQGEHYIATSGDYERYVEKDGVRYHHIMDPATGKPADSGLCSVTIVSDSGLLSDALSTACFVLGAEQGLILAKEFDAEALLVTEELEMVMTEGMKKIFVPEE